ncbi:MULTISPECIES: carboxymuconolactone decarboxylase family protein [unclassified Mesorhizobium]|uniref:carboxymuconolactone decarboxylase family protein n=1 Tax=unclassified Mesorhizobium TaxID=325217 RepID=UPI0008EEE9CB|nr:MULTISPECIES: carboxymuconolactone decarboxylase family protein [unclassified Mesorhizobium]RJG44527.1 carboxymuconolactone decarboxylase family protein [Mesorhizobium sp. DCY119]SFT83276.1 alkylhydroperoxidase AhpD family core domain-containing protein [Mesorhizobium sp. YR577]
MKPRLEFFKADPELLKAVQTLNAKVDQCGLEKSLLHLIKLRASQINGCSFCVDMHTREARADGESEQRVYLVSAWRESPLYSDRERAALEWTETLTRLADKPVTDSLYAETLEHFSEQELVKLSVAVGMINVWNRLCVPFHAIHPVERAKAA